MMCPVIQVDHDDNLGLTTAQRLEIEYLGVLKVHQDTNVYQEKIFPT